MDADTIAALARRPRPFYGLPFRDWLAHRIGWLLVAFLNLFYFRARYHRREIIPRDGPMLLLSNHGNFWDPFNIGIGCWRPLKFMAATSAMRLPFFGKVIQALGAFPKKKFVKDRESMAQVEEHLRNGHAVVIFPEGDRTWDGRPGPVPAGIGRLIKRTGAPVYVAVNPAAYLAHPRWARRPRLVPLDISYAGPFTWPADATPEAIAADVVRAISVLPHRDRSRPAVGWQLAHGLPDLLWACPQCGAIAGLTVATDTLTCRHCAAAWRLDIDAQLHGLGTTPSMDIPEARARIDAHFGSPPILDRSRHAAEGLVAPDEPVRLRHHPREGAAQPAADGRLWVTATRVSIRGAAGEELWGRDFTALDSVSIEVKDQTFLRSDGELYSLVTPPGTALRWGQLLQTWFRSYKPLQ